MTNSKSLWTRTVFSPKTCKSKSKITSSTLKPNMKKRNPIARAKATLPNTCPEATLCLKDAKWKMSNPT